MSEEIKAPEYLETIKYEMDHKLEMVKFALKNEGQSPSYHSFMTRYLNLHRSYLELSFFLESGLSPVESD